MKSFKDSPDRVKAFSKEMDGLGASLKDIYWTLGAYDLVGIVEAPDDETVTAALLKLAGAGNMRSTTLRAFDAKEFSALSKKDD
jgi:uncharacterized protein with GYD domain